MHKMHKFVDKKAWKENIVSQRQGMVLKKEETALSPRPEAIFVILIEKQKFY